MGAALRDFAKRLRLFQPFMSPGAATEEGVVDEARLRAWLRQFRTDEEVDCALQLLQGLKMLTRADVGTSIDEFLSRNEQFRECYLCQLGGPRDSSSIITYYAADLVLKQA